MNATQTMNDVKNLDKCQFLACWDSVAGEWVSGDTDDSGKIARAWWAKGIDFVRVKRTWTTFKRAFNEAGDRDMVEMTITGPKAADYVLQSLPTVRIISAMEGEVLVQWSF